MEPGTNLSPQGLKDSCCWERNIRWIRFRIKERLRVVVGSQNFLRQRSQRRGVGGTPAWRATGLAVAHVLQDNTMMATVACSVARQECQKRIGWFNIWMSKLRSELGLSAVGATLMSSSEPAQGEPLVLQSPVASVDTPGIDRNSTRDMKLDYYEGIRKFTRKLAQTTASFRILVDDHHHRFLGGNSSSLNNSLLFFLNPTRFFTICYYVKICIMCGKKISSGLHCHNECPY